MSEERDRGMAPPGLAKKNWEPNQFKSEQPYAFEMLSHVLKCRLISFNYSSFSMLIEASNSLLDRREREALSAARCLCVKAAREFLAGASSGLSLQVIRTRL